MKKIIKKIWPLIAILLFWFIFSSPFFLKGEIPFAGDYEVTFFPPWSQYSQFAMPVKNNAMPDVIDQLYPWKHLVVQEWKSGQIPLWNPYVFAGTPLMANNQSAVFSPMNILFFIFSFKIAWALLILLQPLLAGFGMYWYARKISISQMGSLLSAVSFMFCGFLVSWMGYGTLDYAIGILPFILLGMEGFLASKKFKYIFIIATGMCFSFFSGHFQMSLYMFFAVFLYYLFRFLPTKNIKIILIGFLTLTSGILLAAIQLFPSIEFYLQSLRSTLFDRPEIIPWQYFITIIAPDFFGNPVTRNVWFGHYAEWNSYIGVIPFVLGLYSILFWKNNKYIRFYIFLALFSLLLATSTVLNNVILFLHIPVLATSAAGRIIVLLSFSFAVLAGIGLDYWLQTSKEKRLFLGGISFTILILGWVVIFGKIGLTLEHAQIAKQNFVLPSLFLFFISIASFATFIFNKKRFFIIIATFFVFATFLDMYRFASKWQSFSPQNQIFPDVGVIKFFQKIKNKRSFGNYGGEVSMYYQLPSVEGYDALYPERFGEFVSYVAGGKINPANRSVVEFPRNGKYSRLALNLLGVSYIIQKISDMNKSWSYPVWQYPNDFNVVYQDNAYVVLKNKYAFPRAFLVTHYRVVQKKSDILNELFSPSINPRDTLILEKDPQLSKKIDFSGRTNILSYSFNYVVLKTQSNAKALLFLSDTYFPGWHAYIDGKETPIYRTDYTFRAISVPAGAHIIVFNYFPRSFIYGIWAACIGIATLIAVYLFQKRSFL